MNGVEVKKTYSHDFEKIYPLLQKFDSPYTQEDWRRIFSYQWDGTENYVGFHLEHKGDVVGFMGLIFSCRYKHNQKYKCCNITSLIVKEAYRSATILLIRKIKQLEDTIFTGLGPIEESHRLFSMVGFIAYESYYKIIPTVNYLVSRKHKIEVYELPDVLDRVSAENKRIAIDHANLKCKNILFDFNGNYCMLIYKIKKQNHYGLLIKKIHIHYVSDILLFNQNIYPILGVFNERLGLLAAIYIDSRFVHKKLLFSITKQVNPPRICRNQYSNQIDIDELYSEAILL